MLNKTLARLSSAADLLRPRTFFRTLARVDQLHDAQRQLSTTVEALRVQTEQLRTIQRLNVEWQDDLAQLDVMLDPVRISAHIRAAVNAAPLHSDPFPHVVVDKWLPPDVYAAIVRALPPAVFFADREESRQRLLVPFTYAPAYSQRVWKFVANKIVPDALSQALNEKFLDAIREYAGTICDGWVEHMDQRLSDSDGRIILRRPGYVIQPHRDPKWAFVTGLVYLARDGDNEAYGTQLYSVRDDGEAPNDKPLYIDEQRCELVKSVPFRPNTLLGFLNSRGAHGASIPEDAMPATLERYVYQFRLGPDASAMRRLLQLMPAERRKLWSGAKVRKYIRRERQDQS